MPDDDSLDIEMEIILAGPNHSVVKVFLSLALYFSTLKLKLNNDYEAKYQLYFEGIHTHI